MPENQNTHDVASAQKTKPPEKEQEIVIEGSSVAEEKTEKEEDSLSTEKPILSEDISQRNVQMKEENDAIKIEKDPYKQTEKEETEEALRNIFEKSMHQKIASEIDMEVESISKNDTRLNRLLQILTSVIVGTMMISATILLETGESDSEWGTVPNYVLSEEKTNITLLSKESFLVSLRQAVFGGETIQATSGLAEIRFFDGSSIRMQEGAEISIEQIEPFPIIRHKQGDIWVLSQRFLVMKYDNAEFYARESSAEFSRKGEKISVSAFRRPLFGEIWSSENSKRTLMTIPPKKKIVFAQNALPSTLSAIHFSKLKKELQLQSAEDSDWVWQNVAMDRRIQNTLYENISNHKKVKLKSEGILANISEVLTFFPSREKRNTRTEKENREKAYYDEYIFGGSSYGLGIKESSDSVLDTALYYSILARPDVRILKNTRQLINEVIERKDFPNKRTIIAQTILSILEDSLYARDSELAEKVMGEIVGLFSREKESEENKRMLEMYRETIAELMRKNMDQVTSDFFAFATRLDELALEWEKEERIVVALEIVERNIETAESFLKKMQFEKAENVIDINNILLQIQPTAKLITAYRDVKKKQSLLEEKQQIFSERKEVLSDAEFHAILSEKEAAKKTIETIKQTQDIFSELNKTQNQSMITKEEKPLIEMIRDDFATNDLVAISILGIENEEANMVEILEGRLEDGTVFSAGYIPHLMVIQDIKIPSEELMIPGDILLADVNTAVQTMRSERMGIKPNTLESEVKQQEEDWKKTGEDPLEGVDPLIIEVSRRLLLAELQNNGFEANLPDIQMVSKNMIKVSSARPESIGGKESVSFDFNTQTNLLSNVRLSASGVQINARTINELEEKMIAAITQYAEEQENIENLLFIFSSAKANTKDANIDFENGTIEFYNISYETWKLSGSADPQKETIVMLQRDGLPLASNIPYNALQNILEEKWGIYTGEE